MDQVLQLMPTRIEEAVKGTPISVVCKVVDPLKIESFIAFLLTREVAAMWNGDQRLNLQGHQIPTIAKTLIEEFKTENLADFTICFRRGVMGFYTDEKDKLLRIDGAVVTGWMRKYLDEKYQVIETTHTKAKEAEPTKAERQAFVRELMERTLKETGAEMPTDQSNAKENSIQRQKLREPIPETPVENVEARIKRIREYQEKALRDKYPQATDEEIKAMLKKL